MAQAALLIESSEPSSSVEMALLRAGCQLKPEVWVRVKEHLAPALALSRGNMTLDNVMWLQREERAQMWIISTAADRVAGVLFTEVYTFVSGKRSLRVIVAGGKGILGESRDAVLATLESFALDIGCQSLLVEGRKGWEKALPDFRFAAVVLEKEL